MPASGAIKLVASDLDGTLFGPDHVPEARTVAAVNALADRGIVIAAVTGRSKFGGVERATRTGAKLDYFVGSNGGHRVNVASGTLEERLVFDQAVVRELRAELPAALGEIGFGFEHDDGFSWSDVFVAHHPEAFDGGPRIASSVTKSTTEIGKIMVSHPEIGTTDLVALVEPHLPDGVHVTTSGVQFVEVTPAGADKGSALARLAGKLGFDRTEIIAFGDNHNDLSMLEWAGRGIAMGNATAAVIERADEVTASNVDFGVAAVLEQLL